VLETTINIKPVAINTADNIGMTNGRSHTQEQSQHDCKHHYVFGRPIQISNWPRLIQ